MPTYVPNVMCSPHYEGRSKPPSRLVLDEPKRTTEVVGGYELGEGTEDGGCLVDESGLLRLCEYLSRSPGSAGAIVLMCSMFRRLFRAADVHRTGMRGLGELSSRMVI